MRWRRRHQIIMCIIGHHALVMLWILSPSCDCVKIDESAMPVLPPVNLHPLESSSHLPVAESQAYFEEPEASGESNATSEFLEQEEQENVEEYKYTMHLKFVNASDFDAFPSIKTSFESHIAYHFKENVTDNSKSIVYVKALTLNNESESTLLSANASFGEKDYVPQNGFQPKDNKEDLVLPSAEELHQRVTFQNDSQLSSRVNGTHTTHFHLSHTEREVVDNRADLNTSNYAKQAKFTAHNVSHRLAKTMNTGLAKGTQDGAVAKKSGDGIVDNVTASEEAFQQESDVQTPDEALNISITVRSSSNRSLDSSRPRNETLLPIDNSSGEIEPTNNNSSLFDGDTIKTHVASSNVSMTFGYTSETLPGQANGTTDPTVESIKKEDVLGIGEVVGIVVGVIGVVSIVGGVFGYLIYHRRFRPLSDIKYPTDNCAYVDDSLRVSYINNHIELPKDNSEEMFSLDNDSFLNSLEAMTLQNYWAEDAKNTKV